ncbi:hypothetical protein [Mesorhizobium sp.]|uniref:hypothetical protein n=1 Tax=Mesorhizobium sp. TaxID=1871066 RepID=UPI0025EF71AC|nr:hypothetical protein [Mesorhizobium sp.]
MAEQTDSLESGTILIGDLGTDDRDEMFSLYEKYYTATDRGRFERDLSQKNAVVVVRGKQGIVGFSTLVVDRQVIDGETVHYLFSGDTVLDSSRWGDPVLLRAWFRAAGVAKSTIGEGRFFWFSIVKGDRTFRILPNFFREFVPAIDGKDRSDLERIRNLIATARYGRFFDTRTGLIDFGQSLGHLRQEWARVEEKAARNRYAAFFLRANPWYFRGVELACLAEFDLANLKRYGAASFAEGLRGGR